MTRFYFDQRWCGTDGIGRFARELHSRVLGMADLPLTGSPTGPLDSYRLAKTLGKHSAKGYFSPGFNLPLHAKCPTICTVHDLIHIHFKEECSLGKLAYYKLVQRPAVRRSPLVMTVSEFSRQQIAEWYELPLDRIVCVGNGVSRAFVPEGPKFESAQPYFLYVGNSKPHKNVPTLLEAFSQLRDRRSINLVLVSSSTASLQRHMERLGISEQVVFRTGLTDDQLAQLYRSAIATVLPSYFEGFGLPLVEAMACGCPVIGANATSIPEIIEEAGLLFDPKRVDELTSCLSSVLENESRRVDLAKRGISRSALFRWEQVSAKVSGAIAPFL